MKRSFSNEGFRVLQMFAYLLIASWPTKAAVHVVHFTPYNCQLPTGYDTLVHCMDGDSVWIINAVPSQFAGNYFLERNLVILDTVSSVPGDTMWRWVITPSDSMLSIHVQTMPGNCYGQRYLLQRISTVEERTPNLNYSRSGRELTFTGVPVNGKFYLMNPIGQLLMETPCDRSGKTTIQVPESATEWIVIVLVAEGISFRWKLLLPRE